MVISGLGTTLLPGVVALHEVSCAPPWLQAAPLSALILQVTDAHLRHGGSGAYYIYLRRRG